VTSPRRRWTLYLSRRPEPSAVADLTSYETDVEQTLERGFRWMYFPRRVESLFEHETGVARTRHLVAVGIVWSLTIVLYAVLSQAGSFVIPGVFRTALILRIGMLLPLVLGVTFAIWWGLEPVPRELAMMAANIIGPVSLLLLVLLFEDGDISLLRGALTLVLLFITVVVRLRFWFATVACIAIVATSFALPPLLEIPEAGNAPLLLATALATLFASYGLEREHRLHYLSNLMTRIRGAQMSEMVAQLQDLSLRDPLTALSNRRWLDSELESLTSIAEPFSVILVDVDAFKAFNDRYGHQEGDDCLKRVASMLRASLRFTTDSVSRVGGEEFAVVLPRTSLEDARITAERMRKAVFDLRIPHDRSPTAPVVSISAGVSETHDGTVPPSEVIAQADAALYRAKSEGRNRVVLFEG
jgi:diguanylate cyclase (GGDEF)-like protein